MIDGQRAHLPVPAVADPNLRPRLEQLDPGWPHLVRIIFGILVFADVILTVQQMAAIEFIRNSPLIEHLVLAVLFETTTNIVYSQISNEFKTWSKSVRLLAAS